MKNTVDYWFVKFYSPMCSHCHIMSPNWRSLASELNAVIKIAAVNCEEDWILCRKEGISSYPSLVLYPSVSMFNFLFVCVLLYCLIFYDTSRKKNIMVREHLMTCRALFSTNCTSNQLKYQATKH